MDPIEAEWRPVRRRSLWGAIPSWTRWTIVLGGAFDLAALLAIVWGLVIGW